MASGLPPNVVPWTPVVLPFAALAVKACPDGKPAADALGDRHDVRRDAGPFIGEQPAGAADAALDLVEEKQDALGVADRPQLLQEGVRNHANAAFALNGLDEDRRRFRRHRLLQGVDVAERDLVEALDLGTEAFEIFLLAAGGDGRQRAPVEGALEGDDAKPLRRAVDEMVAARGLDRCLQRLGANW